MTAHSTIRMIGCSDSGYLVKVDRQGEDSIKVHVDEETFMKLQNVADEDFRSAWFQKYEELDDNNNLQNSNQDHTWYRPRTLLLIELYKQNINRMNNPQVRKKTVWEQITAEINETCETKFQASQVEGRWKTILSSYRKCKDAKKESGAARKDYEFEEELDDILMDSHTTQPAFTFSSGKGNDNSSKRKVEETVEGEEPKKLRTSGSDKVIHFLEGFIEKSERMEKERIEESKRMHNEIMGVFRKLIEALKK